MRKRHFSIVKQAVAAKRVDEKQRAKISILQKKQADLKVERSKSSLCSRIKIKRERGEHDSYLPHDNNLSQSPLAVATTPEKIRFEICRYPKIVIPLQCQKEINDKVNNKINIKN